MPGIWYKVHARSIWNTTSLPWEVSSRKDIEVKANSQHELNQFSETGMLLPGKYSEMRLKPKEKYEVINLRTCWSWSCWLLIMNSIKPKIWLVCSILTNINRKQYFRLEQIWKLLFPRRKTITGNIRISLDYQCIWYFQYRSKISIIVTSFAVSPFWKQRFIRYCIVFKVEKAMKACRRSKDTSALHRGEIWYLTLCCHLGFGVIH